MHFFQACNPGSARNFNVEITNSYREAELEGMKRSDLQILAKDHGIKANMKTVILKKALARVASSNLNEIMAEIGLNIPIQVAKSKICIPTRVQATPLMLHVYQGSDSERIFILEASNLYAMEDLAWMTRSELQRLAKQHGIPTNMKVDGLIKTLAAVGSNLEGNNNVPGSVEQEAITTSASSTEDQTSSVTEDEVSPVAKKSKTKPKGRKRGRRGRRTQEEPVEKKKKEQVVAPVLPVAAVVSSPAVTGRRSRSLQRTSAVSEPTLPTPPISGSRGSTGKRSASGSAGGKAKMVRREMFDESPAEEVLIQVARELKPFGETEQNSPSNLSKAKALIKKSQLKEPDARRAGSMKHGTQKRNDSYMANRGIRGC